MIHYLAHGAVLAMLLGTVYSTAVHSTNGQTNVTWNCDSWWTPFIGESNISCLIYQPPQDYFSGAHHVCGNLNASLVALHSEEKELFVKRLMRVNDSNVIWTGLTNQHSNPAGGFRWLRRHGSEALDYKKELRTRTTDYNKCATISTSAQAWFLVNCSPKYSRLAFFCEKRPKCKKGYFGGHCEKKCHCHGPPCNEKDQDGVCRFGCQSGWMGKRCEKRKEKAKVTYYCVKSKDHGTYVSIMINTKGVTYRNIHGLNSDGAPARWCNDTVMIFGRPSGFVNIKIFITDSNVAGMNAKTCSGEAVDDGVFSWPLVVQERKGLLMDTDQALKVSCNFTVAETLTRRGKSRVSGKTKKPFDTLRKTIEEVFLDVADAYNGQPLNEAQAGMPVRLVIRFGQSPDSLLKGVVPYNCEASSVDGTQRQSLLDRHGCPETDLISAFAKTDNPYVIQTQHFPFFSFENSQEVLLQCSFIFCFVECDTGCDRSLQNVSLPELPLGHHRLGRSTHEDEYHSILRRIRVILPPSRFEYKSNIVDSKVPQKIATTTKTTTSASANSNPTTSAAPDASEARNDEMVQEESFVFQWTSYLFFFLTLISFVIIVMFIHTTSMRSMRASVDNIRDEMDRRFLSYPTRP